MTEYDNKLEQFMFSDILGKKNLTILEFGVRAGTSTKKFVQHCELNGGHVYSVDVDDCSGILKSDQWKFLHCRDDNFAFIEKNIPSEFDIIYLDSFHNAKHVEKIFYHYYPFLKKDGKFYFDDISNIPYLKDNYRDNFNCEINNQETFNMLLEILRANNENIDLYFSFIGSGMAKISKKNNSMLDKPKKIISRRYSFKNFLRKLINR